MVPQPAAMVIDSYHTGNSEGKAHTAPLSSNPGAASHTPSGNHSSPPATQEDEAQSQLADSHDVAVLMTTLHDTRVVMEALQQENERLRDGAAALEALHDYAAHLSSLLAQSTFQNVVAPSYQLLGEGNTKIAASGVYSCAWAGMQPPEHMFAALVTVSKVYVAQLEFRSRERGREAMMAWFGSTNDAERAAIQSQVATFIQLREAGRRYVTLTYPEAMARIWRMMVPPTPIHAALRQRRQVVIVANLTLQQSQIELLRSAWLEYCAGAEQLARESAAQEEQAAASDVAVRARDGAAAAAASAATEARRQAIRRLLLYDRLMNATVMALTWIQATYISVAMAPYAPDYSELCPELLKQAGAL